MFLLVCAFAAAAASGSYVLQNRAAAQTRITRDRGQLVESDSSKLLKASHERYFGRGRTVAADPGKIFAPYGDPIFMPSAIGDLDAAFGTGGKVTTQFGGAEDVALGVALQSDGKIVCVGYSASGTSNVAFVARYNVDGSPDTTFDGDGKVTENFGVGFTTATSVAIQSDGYIVVGGYTRAAAPATTGYDFFLLRYTPTGTLDPLFDGDGKVTTDFASFDEADSVFLQPDNKIVLTGYTNNNTVDRTYAALARYNNDGSPDGSFGTNGKVLGHEGAAFSALIQPDGQIVTGGWGCAAATCTSNLDYTFARYNSLDGSPDVSFGTGGKATVAVSAGRDEARAIVLQTDGKIVASGANLSSPLGDPIAVVRVNTNGTPDLTFGTNGIVQNLSIPVENAFGLSIQPNGKIVTGGRIYPTATDSDFALLRLNANGTPDTTFSGDGFVTTSFGTNLEGIIDFAIQGNGKIVAVGFAENQAGGDIDAALARYVSPVTVSGKISTPDGRGLRNAIVKLTDQAGTQSTTTSAAGLYTFDNVLPGSSVTIKIFSKLYRFDQLVVPVGFDGVTGVNFVGQE
ncbi:MAG: hypothetical protein ABJB40_01225 [Acidobacteriota bacterium]